MVLVYEKKNNIAYLRLNRPEARNAFDPELVVTMSEAWEDYKNDKEMRCAILTGTGDSTFCAGADLGKLIPLITGARKPENEFDEKLVKDPMTTPRAFLRGYQLYKPVIAAINGHAIAGGFELLYGTDIRIACPDAKFGLQEVKWAIFPAGGSTVHLTRQMPYAKAMEILLTGELITAEEALQYGFINKIVPRESLIEEAEKIAGIIAKNGPLAVSAVKQSVLNNIGLPVKEGLEKEFEYSAPVFMSKDAQEGPRAFKEKRAPQFKGE
ncbi:enoyl-CoA hydratase/isomerase family protein [bacterium]|nr:enoyl-CoA hydratase/isomerase family protein [bacterium]